MKNLKEIHINETNILLNGNLVKGGILPGKIAELTRTVTIQADTVVEGPVYAAQMEIQGGETHITGAVFVQRELHINSDAKGIIDFEKCVASSSSVVSRAQKCQVSFHSDINAKSVALVNAFVAGSIYADEITLENCVVIGGIFATQSATLTNCIVGTFNVPSIQVEGTIQLLLPTAFSVEKISYAPGTRMYNLSLADLGALYRGQEESTESGRIEMNMDVDDIRTTLTDENIQKSLHSYTVVGKVLAADLVDYDKFQNHFLLTAAALGPQLLRTYDFGTDANGKVKQLVFDDIRAFFFDMLAGKIEAKPMTGTFNISNFVR
ncbi:MAG: hypothetical protein II789_06475 [Clostridia bacterium]|jgi:hypothetical protein|nr:hypothetical protein [Clostridia bacterium]